MKVVRFLAAPSAVLAALLLVPGAFASDLLDPDTPATPDGFTLPTGHFVATATGTSAPGTTSSNTGTYTVAVFQEGGTGYLDFLYQFSPMVGDLGDMSASNFPPTLPAISGADELQVGWLTALPTLNSAVLPDPFAAPTAGLIDPTQAKYTAADSTVDITFGNNTGTTVLLPGQESAIMVIRTESKIYSPATVLYQDGGQSTSPGYQPTPEPGSVGLLLTSLFAAGLFVARRYQVV